MRQYYPSFLYMLGYSPTVVLVLYVLAIMRL